jgi:hypothetical protein
MLLRLPARDFVHLLNAMKCGIPSKIKYIYQHASVELTRHALNYT